MLFALGFKIHPYLTSVAIQRTMTEFETCARLLSFIRPATKVAPAALPPAAPAKGIEAYGSCILEQENADEEEDIIYTEYVDDFSDDEDYDCEYLFDEDEEDDDFASESSTASISTDNQRSEPDNTRRKRSWSATLSPVVAAA